MASWGNPPSDTSAADLERLAAGLDRQQYAVSLVSSAGRRPHLHITNRQAAVMTEDVYTGDGWYWFGWAERIAPVTDVRAAAEKITRVLRALDAG